MKKMIVGLSTSLLLVLSSAAFADKIVITGSPATLEKSGNMYVLPDSYKNTESYYCVTVDGNKRVCYADKQSNIKIDPVTMDVSVGGVKHTWNCYTYDTNYFTVK